MGQTSAVDDTSAEVAVTVVGRDRPGIIADVTHVLAGLGLNLTDSTMTLLRGHFAMMLICAGRPDAAAVQEALRPLTDGGELLVTVSGVRVRDAAEPTGAGYVLTVHGADRLGIVAAVTRRLAAAGGNITDLTTRLAGDFYLLIVEVELPSTVDANALAAELAEVANSLGVRLSLRPAEPDLL